MSVKYKIVRTVIYTVLTVLILYTGLSCIATWHRAAEQPYLVFGTVRIGFCGYYIMAAVNGMLCILLIIVFSLVHSWFKKQEAGG